MKLFYGLLCWMCALPVMAQVIIFDAEVHEFAPFVVGDTVTHVFHFKNTGDNPLIINKVDAACGCTNIRWTTDPVMPQDSGFVAVSYDSQGHEGNFFKNIHVYSNASRPDFPLLIRGIALPDPSEAPRPVLEKDTIDLGNIPKWTQVKQKIALTNTGKKYLNIHSVTSACNCVHLVSYAGMQIHSGKTKTIEIMYNPQQTGQGHEAVTLHTNSVVTPTVIVILKGNVVEKLLDSDH
ncbi:MAG: DUF1573 domain-containing protein [Bernardetiaceae bacterium]